MTVQRSGLFAVFLCLLGFAGCSGPSTHRAGGDGEPRLTEDVEWANADPMQRALQPGDRVHHVGKINSGRRQDPALLADDKIMVPQKWFF
jgi:hypothetical protein